ncbi:Rossmann-fold NAD(P)-binding domain-containing protein [Mangrovicoccus ximenensis]|uniref:hypothetical protein n=1 Tax=Mangrovicoccus ximenensis TaxID=1911570 RepID=UPI000D3A70F7|nr:hypothetical protein [Mangrovicoccus ximenensis]
MTTTVMLADPLAWDDRYLAAFRQHCPEVRFLRWDEAAARAERHDVLLAWQLPPEMEALPASVRKVVCFGAGTDGLDRDPRLPAGMPVARLVDPDQARQMADFKALHQN